MAFKPAIAPFIAHCRYRSKVFHSLVDLKPRHAGNACQTSDYLSVTVSAGVCAYKKGDTPETMIKRADKALYEAKKKGKNRAVAAK